MSHGRFSRPPIKRVFAVELPPEVQGEDDAVGLLNICLYCTRDAAANFQREVKRFMMKIGFEVGKYKHILPQAKGTTNVRAWG